MQKWSFSHQAVVYETTTISAWHGSVVSSDDLRTRSDTCRGPAEVYCSFQHLIAMMRHTLITQSEVPRKVCLKLGYSDYTMYAEPCMVRSPSAPHPYRTFILGIGTSNSNVPHSPAVPSFLGFSSTSIPMKLCHLSSRMAPVIAFRLHSFDTR